MSQTHRRSLPTNHPHNIAWMPLMKNTLIASTLTFTALFTSFPALAMEITADNTRAIQEYRGNVQFIFNADESFSISSENSSHTDNTSVYSGNVIVIFKEISIEADTIILKTRKDGASLLKSEHVSLISE